MRFMDKFNKEAEALKGVDDQGNIQQDIPMQTFLPHKDFSKTASRLDRKRLIKQSVENLQVLKSLAGLYSSGAWKNHPAVKMWEGHEDWLFMYNESIVKEILMRGYKNTTNATFDQIYQDNFMMLQSDTPWWLVS